jgi:endonuclease/exonuclease/phosphatase family metal-dependent hydrolase
MLVSITKRGVAVLVTLCGLAAWSPTGVAEMVNVRIVAANLTSGNEQSYSLDNANHSNLEGAGARILKGLKPDVVLIQEFNTGMSAQRWVARTFGPNYEVAKENGQGIPNGIVSRYPIVAEGEWDDPTQTNRDFAWAKIRLPNGRRLWAISVHLKAGGSVGIRRQQAEELVRRIRDEIPDQDYVVIGGDFNTSERNEPCIAKLGELFQTGEPYPEDQAGDPDTNANRRKPYDWVLADAQLHPCQVVTQLGTDAFTTGLVVDTRVFRPLEIIAPAQESDSGVTNMQHMAVVKDFTIP